MKLKANKSRTYIVLVWATTAFFAFDLQQYVTLYDIRTQQHSILKYYDKSSFVIRVVYGLVDVLVTVQNLQVATLFTLLGGALFSLPLGLIIVSFASTVRASLSFLMSRFLALDYVQNNCNKRQSKINKRFELEGASYLTTLLLVPTFSFLIISLGMAVFLIKSWALYWASQFSISRGKAVYVQAGT